MKRQRRQYRAEESPLEAINRQQQSTSERRNAPRRDKSRYAVGRSSWRSSLLGDPDAKDPRVLYEDFSEFRCG
jgi:hypothetical protein